MVFVNCLIENPAFDSQTKETLTSKKERFGSTCPLPEQLINTVLESGILKALQEWSKALGQSELAQYLNKSDMGLQRRHQRRWPMHSDPHRRRLRQSAGSCRLGCNW